MTYRLFHDMTIGDQKIADCKIAYKSKNGGRVRMYIVDDFPLSFEAKAVEFSRYDCIDGFNNKNVWEKDGARFFVKPLFNATAYYDGVRHLEFNTDGGCDAGYIYCPEMDDIVNMLSIVRDLGVKLTNGWEKWK